MDQSRHHELARVYRRTRYRADIEGHGIDIRVDRMNSALDAQIGWLRSWAFITAHNPRSELHTAAQNQAADRRLQEHLEAHGYRRWPCDAIDAAVEGPTWPVERGWLICNIERSDAIAIARAFAQNAILFGIAGAVAELVFVV